MLFIERFLHMKTIILKEFIQRMKIRKGVCLLLSAIALLFASGCTAIRELPMEKSNPQGGRTADYLLCRELLTAFLKNDGKKFVALLPESLRSSFTVENFKSTREAVLKSAGEAISFQYVTQLELMTFTPHIWKVRFKRTDLRTGKEYTSELLFRVIVGWVDRKPIITSFQFL